MDNHWYYLMKDVKGILRDRNRIDTTFNYSRYNGEDVYIKLLIEPITDTKYHGYIDYKLKSRQFEEDKIFDNKKELDEWLEKINSFMWQDS